LILKIDKDLCFDTLLQVLIIKDLQNLKGGFKKALAGAPFEGSDKPVLAESKNAGVKPALHTETILPG
jgi:hypothetical protein